MKRVKSVLITVMLIVAFLASIIAVNYAFSNRVNTASAAEIVEAKAYSESLQHDQTLESFNRIPSLEEDFKDDEIIVILDGEHSGTGVKDSYYDYNEVMAEFAKVDNLDLDSVEELFKPDPGEVIESPTYRRMYNIKLELPGKGNVIEVIDELLELDMVLSAEPQYIYETVSTAISSPPSDTYYDEQWGLTGTYGIDVETAWEIADGSGIRVGIFEGDIDSGHEDLAGRFGGSNFTPTGVEISHGTHVGGIISAVQDNNMGVAGVSKATLYLLDRSDFVGSLDFAADNDIKIINASFYFGYATNGSVVYYDANPAHAQAIKNYGEKGGLLICSAGNHNLDTDINHHYPSGYGDSRLFPDIDNVISVGAIKSNGKRPTISDWFYDRYGNPQGSNYGENSVHIYAPGDSIYSTYPNNTYGNNSGTSMAAPFVTGTAALILSYNQSLTGAEIKNIILNNATNITINGSNAKLLNAGNALTDVYDPNRLGLQNMGWLDGSGWQIQVTNPRDTEIRVVYNKRMCYGGDGEKWTGLSDIAYFDLPARSSRIVSVDGNRTATHVAFSFVSGNTRYITYANELDEDTYWLNPKVSTATYNRYNVWFDTNDTVGVELSIVGKDGNTWLIDLTNKTGKDRSFSYNSRLCYEGDAQHWTNLDDEENVYLLDGETTDKPLEITENMTATSIAISYSENGHRYICYANKLNVSGTMAIYGRPVMYTKNGMTVAILDKNGNTWEIYLRNNTGSYRTFEYNTKMCYAGDAEKWSGLSDPGYVSLNPGQSTTIYISENFSATSIAISYMDGVYRKIFYAYSLNADTATMQSFASTVDTTVPPESGCVAPGTMITLADGTQKAVEELTGDEMLLVWNMETGTYDSAPILFIDSEQIGHYEVIEASFSDGTTTEIISEHGFWDTDLNEYVYLDENAEDYIGHSFLKKTGDTMTEVTLTNIEISTEVTTAYSPVTYGHLCYYVNGMLSMPGGVTGLMNIFDVDPDTLTIDEEAYAADIAEYGLFTYEEFYESFPVPEEIFNAFNGKYLKVSIGKGLITEEQIGALIERYAEFF